MGDGKIDVGKNPYINKDKIIDKGLNVYKKEKEEYINISVPFNVDGLENVLLVKMSLDNYYTRCNLLNTSVMKIDIKRNEKTNIEDLCNMASMKEVVSMFNLDNITIKIMTFDRNDEYVKQFVICKKDFDNVNNNTFVIIDIRT